MIKHEQKFTTAFKHWLENTDHIKGHAVFELKVALGHSLAFDAVQEHQLIALRKAKHGKFTWKISDDSIGIKPFDVFMYQESQAFLVIAFKQHGRIKKFWVIDIDAWLNIISSAKKKSITEPELMMLSDGVWEYYL